MADSVTAEPTLYLTLYLQRPLLPWPAPSTTQFLETRPFVGGLRALNEYLAAGWTTTPPVVKSPDRGGVDL